MLKGKTYLHYSTQANHVTKRKLIWKVTSNALDVSIISKKGVWVDFEKIVEVVHTTFFIWKSQFQDTRLLKFLHLS